MIQKGEIEFEGRVSRLGGASLSLSFEFSLQSCIIEVEV